MEQLYTALAARYCKPGARVAQDTEVAEMTPGAHPDPTRIEAHVHLNMHGQRIRRHGWTQNAGRIISLNFAEPPVARDSAPQNPAGADP